MRLSFTAENVAEIKAVAGCGDNQGDNTDVCFKIHSLNINTFLAQEFDELDLLRI